MANIFVLADSLAFHGPERSELLTHPGLYPNVMAAALGAEVDVVARMGWTSRDGWWALIKDPNVYSVLLPRADAVVIGVGGMDHLPASLPTYLREGITYMRPGSLRRRVRTAYQILHPHVVRATGGRMRMLPQAATDHYLSRIVAGIRHFHPGTPIVALTPGPYRAPHYPSMRHHAHAVAACGRWARREGVALVELDPIVGPALEVGDCNPDGLHFSWSVHRKIGEALARTLRDALPPDREPSPGRSQASSGTYGAGGTKTTRSSQSG